MRRRSIKRQRWPIFDPSPSSSFSSEAQIHFSISFGRLSAHSHTNRPSSLHNIARLPTSTGWFPKDLGIGIDWELILYGKESILYHDSMAKNESILDSQESGSIQPYCPSSTAPFSLNLSREKPRNTEAANWSTYEESVGRPALGHVFGLEIVWRSAT